MGEKEGAENVAELMHEGGEGVLTTPEDTVPEGVTTPAQGCFEADLPSVRAGALAFGDAGGVRVISDTITPYNQHM